eukprot:SM000200S05842  [mRNA]  locus=s200:241776:243765:- [translate_table: standard]
MCRQDWPKRSYDVAAGTVIASPFLHTRTVHTGEGNTQSQAANRLRREADNLSREAEEGLSSLENLHARCWHESSTPPLHCNCPCGDYHSLASTVSGISGGHINPAVTAAMLVVGKETGASALTKIAAQCLGSIFGAWLLWVVTPLKMVGDFGTHALGPGVSPAQGLLMEIILTFGLVFTIFGTVVDERGQSNLAPIPIGMAVLAGILVGGPYTGGSMNPARSLGPAVISGLFARPFWIYLAGPTIGAILAALFYRYQFLDNK